MNSLRPMREACSAVAGLQSAECPSCCVLAVHRLAGHAASSGWVRVMKPLAC